MTYLLAPVASRAYTCGSLFTGIGGIDLAFVRNGFDVRWQVEIDPFCQSVIRYHAPAYWPNAKLHEDVFNVGKANLESVDVIFGGFPCQDVSGAGKRQGIKEGTRSGLWIEFSRIISEIRPKFVLLENVRGILSKDGVRVLADLANIGYDAEWGIISAAAIGAPHRRERWFCVAYPKGSGDRRIGRTMANPQSNTEKQINGLQFDRYGQTAMGNTNEFGYANRIARMGNEVGKRGSYSKHTTTLEDAIPLAYTYEQRLNQSSTIQESSPDKKRDISTYECDRRTEFYETVASGKNRGYVHAYSQIESILGRAVNGLSQRLDKHQWPARPNETQHEWEAPRTTIEPIPNRSARLKALGNAVVPQVVEPIAAAIRTYLEAATSGTNGGAA